MGMYDTVWFKNKKGEDVDIQFKTGERLCLEYEIGDQIPLANGIHFGYEGAFIVMDGKVLTVFDAQEQFMFDKWGGDIKYPL